MELGKNTSLKHGTYSIMSTAENDIYVVTIKKQRSIPTDFEPSHDNFFYYRTVAFADRESNIFLPEILLNLRKFFRYFYKMQQMLH